MKKLPFLSHFSHGFLYKKADILTTIDFYEYFKSHEMPYAKKTSFLNGEILRI